MAGVEAHLGPHLALRPGYNPGVRFMAHLWEPVRSLYRPLVFYVAMELLAGLCHIMLLAAGFTCYSRRGMAYYTRGLPPPGAAPGRTAAGGAAPGGAQEGGAAAAAGDAAAAAADATAAAAADGVPRKRAFHGGGVAAHGSDVAAARDSWRSARRLGGGGGGGGGGGSPLPPLAAGVGSGDGSSSTSEEADGGCGDGLATPILFLHGVGAALLPYLGFILALADTGRPMLMPEARHVSMRLCQVIPTVDDVAAAAASMLEGHGVGRVLLVGHSYGTAVASRLLQTRPELVAAAALIDPVCFAMYLPGLLLNFLYVRHVSGVPLVDAIMWLVSSEVHCAASFCRGFYWTGINLWAEDVPSRCLVSLGGRDILCSPRRLHDWLRHHTKAKVMFNPNLAHAGFLLNLAWQRQVVEQLHQLLPDGGVGVADGDE